MTDINPALETSKVNQISTEKLSKQSFSTLDTIKDPVLKTTMQNLAAALGLPADKIIAGISGKNTLLLSASPEQLEKITTKKGEYEAVEQNALKGFVKEIVDKKQLKSVVISIDFETVDGRLKISGFTLNGTTQDGEEYQATLKELMKQPGMKAAVDKLRSDLAKYNKNISNSQMEGLAVDIEGLAAADKPAEAQSSVQGTPESGYGLPANYHTITFKLSISNFSSELSDMRNKAYDEIVDAIWSKTQDQIDEENQFVKKQELNKEIKVALQKNLDNRIETLKSQIRVGLNQGAIDSSLRGVNKAVTNAVVSVLSDSNIPESIKSGMIAQINQSLQAIDLESIVMNSVKKELAAETNQNKSVQGS